MNQMSRNAIACVALVAACVSAPACSTDNVTPIGDAGGIATGGTAAGGYAGSAATGGTAAGGGGAGGMAMGGTAAGGGGAAGAAAGGAAPGAAAAGAGTACTESPTVVHTYAVTSANFMYFFDGGTAGNPALTVKRGSTYVFNVAVESIHPFAITTEKALPPTLFSGGVKGQGTAGITSGTITFTVPCNAPDKLAYECTIHGFGNTITTQ